MPTLGFFVYPPVISHESLNVHHITSHNTTVKKPLECAGLAWVDGGLLVQSDRHEHVIFTAPFDLQTMKLTTPNAQVVVPNAHGLLWDGESVAVRPKAGGGYVGYVLCSLSNDKDGRPLPKRRNLLRFTFKSLTSLHDADQDTSAAAKGVVLDATPVREAIQKVFKRFNVEPYRTFSATFGGDDKNTYRWGNVEGMTFTPQGDTLLCGMRNPLVNDKAVLFALNDVDQAFNQRDATLMRVTDMFLLDLNGRGVSEISWDPVTRGYLIVAAKSNGPKLDDDKPFPPSSLDAAVFWWSGNKSDRPTLIARAPQLKLEAVCRLGQSDYIALATDEGDVSEGRDARDSTLIIMEFTGIRKEQD